MHRYFQLDSFLIAIVVVVVVVVAEATPIADSIHRFWLKAEGALAVEGNKMTSL